MSVCWVLFAFWGSRKRAQVALPSPAPLRAAESFAVEWMGALMHWRGQTGLVVHAAPWGPWGAWSQLEHKEPSSVGLKRRGAL